MTTCKNCAAEYEGNSVQTVAKRPKPPVSPSVRCSKDIRDQFIHFDQGFLYTIKELALRPGHSIREYVEGKRVRHVKPIKFMIWAAAISFFIAHFLGFQEHLVQRLQAESEAKGRSTQSTQKLVEFIMGHPNILMLMTIQPIAFLRLVVFSEKATQLRGVLFHKRLFDGPTQHFEYCNQCWICLLERPDGTAPRPHWRPAMVRLDLVFWLDLQSVF
jgi:hypothetical protein